MFGIFEVQLHAQMQHTLSNLFNIFFSKNNTSPEIANLTILIFAFVLFKN